MKYRLTEAVLGNALELEIAPERFVALRRGKDVLLDASAIEEKYEALLSTYISLEHEVVAQAATEMIRHASAHAARLGQCQDCSSEEEPSS